MKLAFSTKVIVLTNAPVTTIVGWKQEKKTVKSSLQQPGFVAKFAR